MIPEPKRGNYDAKHEDMVREMITAHADYAEDGPTFDPDGDYLCGTCSMRKEPHACTVVAGRIDMEEMGCRRWEGGEPMPTEMGEKSDPRTVALSKVASGGFGCHRCRFASKADSADKEGRTLWCGDWGCHVLPMACCDEEDQEGLVEVLAFQAASNKPNVNRLQAMMKG